MTAAIDWTKTDVLVAIIIGVLALAAAIIVPVSLARWQDRRSQERAKSNAAGREQQAITTTDWKLRAHLRPKAGLGAGQPPRAPVKLRAAGLSPWVRDVRLSWTWSKEGSAPWVTDDALCDPWTETALPVQLLDGLKTEWAWPEDQPERLAAPVPAATSPARHAGQSAAVIDPMARSSNVGAR